MIQIATALPSVSVGPARPVLLAAQSGASNFALALSSLLAPGSAPKVQPGEAAVPQVAVPGRQIAAEPGKDLPEIALDLDCDDEAPQPDANAEDDKPEAEALPLAWFVPPSAPLPDAAVPAARAPVAAKPDMVQQPSLELPLPVASTEPALAEPTPVATAQPAPLAEATPAALPPAGSPPARPVLVAPRAVLPIEVAETPKPAMPDPAPVPGVASAVVAQPVAKPARSFPVAADTPAAPHVMRAGTPSPVLEIPTAAHAPAAPPPGPYARATTAISQMPAITVVQPAVAPSNFAASQTVPTVESPLAQAIAQPAPTRAPAAVPAPVAMPMPMPVPVPVPAPAPLASAPVPVPVSVPVPVPAPTSAPAAVSASATAPSPLVSVAAAVPQATAETVSAPPPPQRADPAPAAPSPRADAPAVQAQPVPQPAAAPPVPMTIATLIAQSHALAAQPAIAAPLSRALRDPDQPQLAGIAAPGAAALQTAAPALDAQPGTLDMRRQEWTGKMVEMIEAMREAAPVKETRISLMPDALGKVDISVRQDGDRVHVHFAAETQAARQILTDAQPRLAELAEQRGVRLGQTSVDSGQTGANAQSGQRHNEAQRPHTPAAPAGARAAKDQLNPSDERVA